MPAPDLSLQLKVIGNSSPRPGESFELNVTVMNRGTGAAEYTTVTFYRSTDSKITSGDADIGSRQIAMLDALQSSRVSIRETAASIPGKYYYGACAEYESGEAERTGRCSNSAVVTVVPHPPDLVVDAPTLGGRNPTGGETFTLHFQVHNRGAGASATTTLNVYRSADSIIGIDDTYVGSVQIGALDPEGSSVQSVELQAFLTPGTYHYGACLDRVFNESGYRDICSQAAAVSVLSSETATSQRLKNTSGPVPRAMAHAYWNWPKGYGSDELEVPVTIHNDIELRGDLGLYVIGCTGSSIAGNTFYFGLQTDVRVPGRGGQGKGAIFSRWNERDLSYSRVPADGWTESGGYEGQFISVRGQYEWGVGQYLLRVRAEETDEHGRWFGFHVENGSGSEQWIGSLRFPLKDGVAQIEWTCISAVEVYGLRRVMPTEIPYWRVTVDAPVGDHLPASLSDAYYPANVESLRNALISVGDQDATFEVGLDYIATWRIQGAIVGSAEQFGLDIVGEGKRRRAKADEDGYFQALVSPGTYVLKVNELVGSDWRVLGWYDGNGGLTNDSEKAHPLTVDGADLEGIEINLP